MYLVVEPVRLVLEAFGARDKWRLSTDMAQKCPKFGFTLQPALCQSNKIQSCSTVIRALLKAHHLSSMYMVMKFLEPYFN